MVDGMARMQHQDRVVIPARKQVCFEPGGMHMMMPAPAQRLVAGDRVKLDLLFANGSRQPIQVPVKVP
jgi:copper(I)-binding protein